MVSLSVRESKISHQKPAHAFIRYLLYHSVECYFVSIDIFSKLWDGKAKKNTSVAGTARDVVQAILDNKSNYLVSTILWVAK